MLKRADDGVSRRDRPPAGMVRERPDQPRVTKLILTGQVQGVGFRPFVYRLARQHGLNGQVQNCLGEVEILAAGSAAALRRFEHDLVQHAPPLARPVIASRGMVERPPFREFSIVASAATDTARIYVPPDYFMCDDCRRELHDPGDRRYRYPFINCTQCGPRYTLIRQLPYDRANTSMAQFPLCADCSAEYENPADRRFHAEPLACPACGPQVQLHAADGSVLAERDAALSAAITRLRLGQVIAVRGIGGYHLMCDAGNPAAVATLRLRKKRPDKPLAVMFPLAGTDGLDRVRQTVNPTPDEEAMLTSPARPIVLVRKNAHYSLAGNVAPRLGELGVFMPYSPLHQLLLEGFGAPLVATSGNISGEPVLTGTSEATTRLQDIADAFLHHDRPIVRPADDSVMRRIAGSLRPLRIGRGVAPAEIELPWWQRAPVLAVGGHMKGTLALSWEDRVVVSPHIGEMDSPRSLAVFEQVAADLQTLYGVQARRIVCDAHPGYTTHRWAGAQTSLPVLTVWHHRAHASALAAEFVRPGSWLTFTWDGVGLGEDGSLWGGEALLGEPGNWKRVCSMRPFRLPGGERAGREPWRSAAALHWECGRSFPCSPDQDGLCKHAWLRRLNCPETSAVGRLFDAASALVCDTGHTSFEAQGPMYLESLCRGPGELWPMPLGKGPDGIYRSDWEPLLALLADRQRSPELRAEAFHSSMAMALVTQARRIRDEARIDQVGLCGGVFQNRVLTDQVVALLEADNFEVYVAERLPCNDAALCFGQAAELAARERHG